MRSAVVIRPMGKDEKGETGRVMRRAFPPSAWLFLSWSRHVLVADLDGHIVGGVIMKLFTPTRGRKVGFVSWIFSDPEARGLGVGQALIEGALAFFEEQGCDEVSACVEGYNSSSAKLFATRGFSILSPGEQFRRYGLGLIPYWWHAFHFIDVGHFLWVKPGAAQPDSPALQWVGTWVVNTLLLWLVAWRQGAFGPRDLWVTPLVLLVLFGVRTLAMWAVAKAQGLAVRFRAWESSVPLVAAIALIFGGYFPFPGSLYPEGDRWRYRDLVPKLGPVALAGSLAVLALTGGSWLALQGSPAAALQLPLLMLFQLGRILALLDTAIAAFPLVSFNGRRLWDWHRPVWALLSVAALVLLFAAKVG